MSYITQKLILRSMVHILDILDEIMLVEVGILMHHLYQNHMVVDMVKLFFTLLDYITVLLLVGVNITLLSWGKLGW